jgi:hypothetical protein
VSNSMHIPVVRFPINLEELAKIVGNAFLDFGLEAPKLVFYPNSSGQGSIEGSIILAESDVRNNFCWITFGEYPEEVTGYDSTGLMASVKTRGSWLFAAIVSLGLLRLGGAMVFNDGGELDGKNEYTESDLKELIKKSIKIGEIYICK